MSGTSLDGLDIAYCDITDGGHAFSLIAAETIPYPSEWQQRLSQLQSSSALEYALADVELGHYFGRQVCAFQKRHPGEVQLIASHGHTIFHQPQKCLTTQIGDGAAIAAETGLPVAFDFRNLDVALGGQGAPLVPIGDEFLFSQYGACLNLGGFSNISFQNSSKIRVAFDVSPCNMALNLLARELGHAYDKDGLLAMQGSVNQSLLQQLDSLAYYAQPSPKSLGKEWFDTQVLPLLGSEISTIDKLATITYHIAYQIAVVLNNIVGENRRVICTGGGAKNKYLISLLQKLSPEWQVSVPTDDIIDYKEAIIFALLGYLRFYGKENTLKSVTGATRNSVGGSLVF